jgi:hypothetical protein
VLLKGIAFTDGVLLRRRILAEEIAEIEKVGLCTGALRARVKLPAADELLYR